jgi:hypothetical protein
MTGRLHSLADARSLALHQAVAERLKLDPAIVARARARVAAWSLEPERHPYALPWQKLLDQELEALCLALTRSDAEMCTLRQASPFAGALDAKTRWAILKHPSLRACAEG